MCKVFSRGFLPWFSLSSAGDGDAGSQKLGWTYIPKLGPPLLTPFGETKKTLLINLSEQKVTERKDKTNDSKA